jgi:GxxExxY protein
MDGNKKPAPDEPLWTRIINNVAQLSLAQRLDLIAHLKEIAKRDIAHLKVNDEAHLVKLTTDELTYKIIGLAMQVHRGQGPGLREDTYQRDLESHLATARLLFTPQQLLEVFDSQQGGKLIGYYIPDFIVDRRVVLEIKALNGLDNSHIAQVIGYLAVSGCAVGLLFNFGERNLQWKRILQPKDVQEHQVNRQWLFVPDWLRRE